VTLINDEIIESSAKMNEYYLENGGDDQRQYTMCHEVRVCSALFVFLFFVTRSKKTVFVAPFSPTWPRRWYITLHANAH